MQEITWKRTYKFNSACW